MSRPIHANSDETRRRILDAAIELFARDGFHGAATRELAALAGVNIATLHYYHDGKQGLYDAAVDEVYRRLAVRMRGAFAAARPDNLDQLVAELYAAARLERDGVRVLVRQVLDEGRLTERTSERHFLPGVEGVASLAAGLLGFSPAQARAAVVALSYLASRYVIQDDDSLRLALGVETDREANHLVVKTLQTTARALLGANPTQAKE